MTAYGIRLFQVLLLHAVRYKKLERYLFHNISLCIPSHTRTHNCSSRNVQHTFHRSDRANWDMGTEKKKKMMSSRRAVMGSRSFGCVLRVFYSVSLIFSSWMASSKQAVFRVSFQKFKISTAIFFLFFSPIDWAKLFQQFERKDSTLTRWKVTKRNKEKCLIF